MLGLAFAACESRDATIAASIPHPTATVGWPAYAGDEKSLRYSGLDDIDRSNIGSLERVWSWNTEEDGLASLANRKVLVPGKFEATPLAFGDTLFLSTPFNRVIALDGRSGKSLWTFDPRAYDFGLIADDRAGFVHRGVASAIVSGQRRIFHASRGSLFALDASTGRRITTFGDSGAVDLTSHLRWDTDPAHYGNTSPPVVFRNVVIVGSAIGDRLVYERDPPGDVQAFDVKTGRRLWRWDPVPPSGSKERESWEQNSAASAGHANVWAPFSVDVIRGLVYLPVSAASNDFYGGNRLGDNLYSQSLVCLDATTGRLVWAQQLVHHDLWDFDPASPPALTTSTRAGREVDEVWLAGKTGFLYAFDRTTGIPVWPLQERPVSSSDVPGERTASTQPHPPWPRPFASQGFSSNDLVDFSPSIRARAESLITSRVVGPIFTPPTEVGTVQMPGWIGGAGWGAMTVDPVRQILFVKATNVPILAKLKATGDARRFMADDVVDPSRAVSLMLSDDRWWVRRKVPAIRVPISKPPYGTLSAYDLGSGERRWAIVLGDMPEIRGHPALRGLSLPQLGVAGAPGGLATASGIIFITGGGRMLYGIDSESGHQLWQFDLGQIGYSNPMTFRASDGRQYVVIATGDGRGASLQAFALPLLH